VTSLLRRDRERFIGHQDYARFVGKWCEMSDGSNTVEGVVQSIVDSPDGTCVMTVDKFGLWITDRFTITHEERLHE